MLWIGVDVGGTFTDLVILDDETGQIRVGKRPSTPARPDEAVLSVIDGATRPDELGVARGFLHGTTVGINALLERGTMVRLALLTTRGFRDVLEIRRGDRDATLQPVLGAPAAARAPAAAPAGRPSGSAPTVPSTRRSSARGRSRGGGAASPRRGSSRSRSCSSTPTPIRSTSCRPIGACVRPDSRARSRSRTRPRASTASTSAPATTVDRRLRPAARVRTTCAGSRRPGRRGFDGELPDHALGGRRDDLRARREARPFETILSGPVAGAEGAPSSARDLGIDAGDHRRRRRHELRHLPDRRRPAPDASTRARWTACRCRRPGSTSARSAPAGARSPTSTRAACCGVGRGSAGAVPGPVLLRALAALEPTVTDAARGARHARPSASCAGGVSLDIDASRRGAGRALGPRARVSTSQDAARGIVTIVTASMANAIRRSRSSRAGSPGGRADGVRRRRARCSRPCSPASSASATWSSPRTPATSRPGGCSAPT